MAFLTTHDINLYYECHGDGPPLMLIAGLASDAQSWMPVVPALSRHFTLILPDNRGAGQTRPLDAPISIKAMAQDHAALITHLGYSTLHVAGHSMGGAIALELALQRPDLVDHLVLAATNARLSKRNRVLFNDLDTLRQTSVDKVLWYKMLFQWLFKPTFFDDEKKVEDAAKLACAYRFAQSDLNFSRQLQAAYAVDFRDSLKDISAQTLVLLAQMDVLFPIDEAKSALKNIPNSTIHIIENTAHSIHWDNPEAFSEALIDFLPKLNEL